MSEQWSETQTVSERGEHNAIVRHSPYGRTRNAAYGWSELFGSPSFSAKEHDFRIHIGTSSLNSVPGRDRSFCALFKKYRRKFNSLEHCYPYHRLGTPETWREWRTAACENSATRCDDSGMKARCESAGPTPTSPPPTSTSTNTYAVSRCRFIFTVKANKFLTHEKMLNCDLQEVREHVHLFFSCLCCQLAPYLGPVLLQLPPSFPKTETTMQRLRQFNALLPQDDVILVYTDEEKYQQRDGSKTVIGSAAAEGVRQRRVRIAVEFRHDSWYDAETFALCREFQWAVVVSHTGITGRESAVNFSHHVDTGAAFMYCRLHGPLSMYTGDYGPTGMERWAEMARRFLLVNPFGEVFIFLNNNDSNVGGVTSSTVDATYLSTLLRNVQEETKEKPIVSTDNTDVEVEEVKSNPPFKRGKRDRSNSVVIVSD